MSLLLDMDGVLYRGSTVLPGVPQALDIASTQGYTLLFATNNGWAPHEQILDRLHSMGFSAEPDTVMTAAIASARLLHRHWPATRRPYVLGSEEVARQLRDAGLTPVPSDDEMTADSLVVGLDLHLSYRKLTHAQAVGLQGVPFVATDLDGAYPWEDRWLPGSGAIVAAVEASIGRKATNAGKPSPLMYELLLECAPPSSIPVVIGDNLKTDIRAGRSAGFPTVAVLTGIASAEAIATAVPEERPDYVASDLLDAVTRVLPQILAASGGPVSIAR
ncbi:MAG: HAD-IIA family hydrolase [Chloroflexi bacterium]|nr:HAD-IIA family hydrolase [Chloroflexota bacterium]